MDDGRKWMRVFGTPYSLLRLAWCAGSLLAGFVIGYYVL
jgi:hypothetical protein